MRVPLPSVGQREALSFGPGGSSMAYITRERRGGVGVADLYRVELSGQDSAAWED